MPRELPLPPTVTAEVRNIEYTEVSGSVTITEGGTTGTVTLTLPTKEVTIESVRVYPPTGFTGSYTIEVSDSTGKAIYRFRDAYGPIVDLVGVIIRDENAQLVARITTTAPVTANTTFEVRVGISYIA